MIKAEVVADSLSPQGDRLISLLITFPRIILAEVNTHRMLSKNTSSSRAIPFNKMVEAIQENPFIPIAWQSHHSGMQGTDYLDGDSEVKLLENKWLESRDLAIQQATLLNNSNVTKQLCNRLLEPFMWTTMLITGSKKGWDNFFKLRCPQYSISELIDGDDRVFKSKKDLLKELDYDPIFPDSDLDWLNINKGQAEIHMMALAEAIYDAMNESTPKQLEAGQWHIPFGDRIQDRDIMQHVKGSFNSRTEVEEAIQKFKIKISTAMAARTSYTVVGDEKEINYERMIELHDRLISQDPPHSSPMEHCARAMSQLEYRNFTKTTPYPDENGHTESEGWCRNFKGFIPYRYLIENDYEQ